MKEEKGIKGNPLQDFNPRHPLSFWHYKRIANPDNHESVQAIEYFLKKWESRFGRPHVPLKVRDWENLTRSFLSAFNDEHLDVDLCCDECCRMIDKFFDTKFPFETDYGIMLFNSPEVKANRFFETDYYT